MTASPSAGDPGERDARALRRGRRAGYAVAGLAALVLAAQLTWIGAHLEWLRPLEAGRPAPMFDLPVIGERRELGERIQRDTLRGKVVVLEFWATWCGPCRASLPRLAAAANRWGDRAVVIAVNLDDADKARRFIATLGPTSLHSVADAGGAANAYRVDVLPHVVVIDPAGLVRQVARGGRAVDAADRAVQRLLDEMAAMPAAR